MHNTVKPNRMYRNKRRRVAKLTNWDRVANGRDLARLREKYGTRAERRRARFAELKAEQKKTERRPVIPSPMSDWLNKKGWKQTAAPVPSP